MTTPTPARPALDASRLADELERLRDRARKAAGQIAISECATEFSTAVRDNFETITAALRSLADMRGAIEKAKTALGFYADPWSHKDEGGDKVRVPDFYSELDFEGVANAALTEIDAALARSAP